ncbi:MAG: apolipoprotein N-acyltransferase, partial [Treponema sp.]|nr:apolipoprotein N-acyltransferase [Treponema sp.]
MALIPVFISIHRVSLKSAWLWGLFYGSLSYGLLCYWLASFNPYTIYIGVLGFALMTALVFELLKLTDTLFSRKSPGNSPYAMALLWCVYEYLKTKGFLGFSYGIIGYSQWRCRLLIQSASLFGVWGVSALCVFTSAFFSSIVLTAWSLGGGEKKSLSGKNLLEALKSEMIPAVILFASFMFFFVFGAARLSSCGKKSAGKSLSVACIQNNTDSDKYGFDVYKRDVANLIDLSEKAIAEHPEVELVVWPETAVVPPIVFHYTRKLDEKRVRMIEELLGFMEKSGRAFVIGNQMSVDNGGKYTDDYNAALLFDSEKNNIMPPEPETYYKMHLVPFTEYFPYEKIAPKLYKMLLMGDTHFWTPGNEAKVFSARGLDFSVPICFEDSFGSLCRSFVKNGARCFVNISNDSWSSSNPCQIQHLS